MTNVDDNALFRALIYLLFTCAAVTLLNIFGITYTAIHGRWDWAGLQSLILLVPAYVSYHVLQDYWRHQVIWSEHIEDRATEKETKTERMQQAKEMTENMMRMAATARALVVPDLDDDEPTKKH